MRIRSEKNVLNFMCSIFIIAQHYYVSKYMRWKMNTNEMYSVFKSKYYFISGPLIRLQNETKNIWHWRTRRANQYIIGGSTNGRVLRKMEI